MNRQDLTHAVSLVDPALTNSVGLQPIYRCVNFDGTSITATDGSVSISAPFATAFTGAVEGRRLAQWLAPTAKKSVEVEQEGEALVFKAGRAKAVLPRFGSEVFPVKLAAPTLKKGGGDWASDFDDLAGALGFVTAFSGVDATMEWSTGITMVFGDDLLQVYSTDNVTLASVRIKANVRTKIHGKSAIVPISFLSALVRVLKEAPIKAMQLGQDSVVALFENGVIVHTSVIAGQARPEEYAQRLEIYAKHKVVQIPNGLEAALRRQQAVASGVLAPASVFAVKNGKLRIRTNTPDARSSETMLFGTHPDVVYMGDPSAIVRPLSFVGGICFTPDAAILRSNRIDFLVCALGEEEATTEE